MTMSRICSILLVALLANGCALFHHRQAQPQQPAPAAPARASSSTNAPAAALNPIVTPDNSLSATVAAYNSAGRFVVLTFPVGQNPGLGQTMFLYRNGLKAGEVRITGPQQDNNIVADMITGTAQVGDDVRPQ